MPRFLPIFLCLFLVAGFAERLTAQPLNDELCDATLLTVGNSCNGMPNGTNTNAGLEPGEPDGSCFDGNFNSVWYRFVGPASGLVQISTNFPIGSMSDSQISLYTLPGGDCSDLTDLTEIACNQDASLFNFNATISNVTVVPATSYYVQVSGYQGETGSFCIVVEEVVVPANDAVCNALLLPVNGTTATFSNENASIQAGEEMLSPPAGPGDNSLSWSWSMGSGDTMIQHSVWFKFAVPTSGNLEIDLCSGGGTLFNTQIALYASNDCNQFSSFSLLYANDDRAGGCQSGGLFSASYLAAACLSPGDTLYLLVDGFNGATGTFEVALREINTSITAYQRNPSCPGVADGSLSVWVNGGIGPYTYSWSNGSLEPSLQALAPGTYTVEISNLCGSILQQSYTVNPPPTLSVNAGPSLLNCSGDSIRLGGTPSATGGRARDFDRMLVQDRSTQSLYSRSLSVLNNSSLKGAIPTDLYAADFALGQLWGLGLNTALLQVDSLSPITTQGIGTAQPPSGHFWNGLAFHPQDSVFYALSTDGFSESRLFQIDPQTGVAVFQFQVALPYPLWLAIDNSGNAYIHDASDDYLYELTLQTGTLQRIGYLGFQSDGVEGADFHPLTNRLYIAGVALGDSLSRLREVNVQTGLSLIVGDFDANSQVSALAIRPEVFPAYTYLWTPAAGLSNPFGANPLLAPTEQGLFQLVVTDGCQTQGMDTLSVSLSNGLSIELEARSDNGGGLGGEVSVVATGGTPPFHYSWNTGDTTASVSGLGAGVYTVWVSDAAGCSVVDSVRVGAVGIDTLRELEMGQFSVYPNPSQGRVWLRFIASQPDHYQLSLYNLQGQVVWEERIWINDTLEKEVNWSALVSGPYVLRLRGKAGTLSRRFQITP